MSHRPINEKRAARMRKAIMRRPLPAYVDPVKWLRSWRYADTAGGARKIIKDERLKIDSHPVGFADVKRELEDGSVTTERVIVDVPATDAARLVVV